MDQDDNAHRQQAVAPQMDRRDRGRIIMVARVVTTIVVAVLAGVLFFANFVAAMLVAAGPDSCDQVSCESSTIVTVGYLALAAMSAIGAVGIWFAARSTRRMPRSVLSVIAVVIPLIADLIVLSNFQP